MGKFVLVGVVNDFPEGVMREVKADDREVLMVRSGGKFYAAAARCPHMGGRLAQGKLEGTVVTCPLHGSQFDLSDGHVVRWLKGTGALSAIGKAMKGPRGLLIYNVKVQDEKVLVEI
jgi:3-phenylpropionate/trans-cinnamate dioxygenase ferredoxin subunit